MRVEVIHWQAVDATEERCGISVFVNGVDVVSEMHEVIPSREASRVIWDEATDFACSWATSAVADVLRDARDDAADISIYIKGEHVNP